MRRLDYARALRVIGQVLEAVRARACDIVCYGDCYLVRCSLPEEERPARQPGFLRLWKKEARDFRGTAYPLGNARRAMNAEFLYSLKELEQLDDAAKLQRRQLSGMPDPYGFSNVLRTVGMHLSRVPRTRLRFLSSRNRHIDVLYETAEGVRKLEEYPLDALYDHWVKNYLKRGVWL